MRFQVVRIQYDIPNTLESFQMESYCFVLGFRIMLCHAEIVYIGFNKLLLYTGSPILAMADFRTYLAGPSKKLYWLTKLHVRF